jgi:hypothetical protein
LYLFAFHRANGHVLIADGSVFEDTAARILGISPGTLRNQRSLGTAIPWYRHRNGRIRYRISDLAAALEAQGEK